MGNGTLFTAFVNLLQSLLTPNERKGNFLRLENQEGRGEKRLSVSERKNKTGFRPVSWQQQGYCFMLNAEEARGSPQKPVEARRLFPAFFTTFCYLCFCFVCYAVQSLSRQYKTLSPFLGGGWVHKSHS
jgi:hypothetical protein